MVAAPSGATTPVRVTEVALRTVAPPVVAWAGGGPAVLKVIVFVVTVPAALAATRST
ncbi:hypothetical protein [Conexibacter sp. DBS9H8]|uniref:hypothetical protein n=1 Tax=Conexibacter sp. DBS9H8 TaxID=2937801 RepID=UPI00200F3553|nr:hypothetical protein [Conexibacter sp. DBS9H8]